MGVLPVAPEDSILARALLGLLSLLCLCSLGAMLNIPARQPGNGTSGVEVYLASDSPLVSRALEGCSWKFLC